MTVTKNSVRSQQSQYGRRLFPVYIDQLAMEDPSRVIFHLPRSSQYSAGVRHIDVALFAQAIDRAAWWLEKTFGKCTNYPAVAYIGPFDLRYFIFMVATMKCRMQILLPSPRNNGPTQAALLDATNCTAIIRARTTSVEYILACKKLPTVIAPELEELLDCEEVHPYPFDETFEAAKNVPTIIFHSSGSTGAPKPIPYRLGSICTVDCHNIIRTEHGQRSVTCCFGKGTRVLNCLPPFHGAGVSIGLIAAVYMGYSTVFPPVDVPLSANLIDDVLDNGEADSALIPPALLEEACKSSESLEKFQKFDTVIYGGGPLSQHAGNLISKKTILRNIIGATECGIYPSIAHEPEDWAWFRFDPSMKGIQMQDRGDDLYELVYVRDPYTDLFHSTWHLFPDKVEYPTKDLYVKHPTKPDLWRLETRTDDIIALSTGEKVYPIIMEDKLRQAPEVKEVLLFGQGRFEIAALIELRDQSSDRNRGDILRTISPYVVEANKVAPSHGQLSTDRILFTKPDRPLLRTGKGTIRRQVTIATYSSEIESLYSELSKTKLAFPKFEIGETSSKTQASLLAIFRAVTGVVDLSADQDLYASGMDSLMVMYVVRHLRSELQDSTPKDLLNRISPRFLYSNPSVEKLSLAIEALHRRNGSQVETNGVNHGHEINTVLSNYVSELPSNPSANDGSTVLLTGSTGSLGSYLLDALLSQKHVRKIYCLNRSADGIGRQTEVNNIRGLPTDWSKKVAFLKASLGEPLLGLSSEDYGHLARGTCVIIHNQWQVDFNLALQSFDPHVRGVLNLIKLAAEAPTKPPIFFTSSVGAVAGWDIAHPGAKVPENAISDITAPIPSGYAESKHIAERLLDAASRTSGVNAANIRVGQIAGSTNTNGMWNKQEWLPTIIASSKQLGKLPDSLGDRNPITWIPVDQHAKIILELIENARSFSEGPDAWTKYYHLVNPHATSWQSLIPIILKHIGESIEVVPLSIWVQAVRDSMASVKDEATQIPAVKLLDFYEDLSNGGGMADLEVKETMKHSKTMAELEPVTEVLMEKWLKEWDF